MADDTTFDGIRPGIYNVDYFSGSQCAIYIGDVYVDEVTAISFVAQQNRRPLYGYADQYFRDVSKGQILIQGQFSVNFKEAGYLWLILNRYRELLGQNSKLNPFKDTDEAYQQNIEKIVNGEIQPDTRYQAFGQLSEVYAMLSGFSSSTRAGGGRLNEEGKFEATVGKAENVFETFENKVWGAPNAELESANRSPDDVDLNPFDIYITYGDFQGNDRVNHTIVKLDSVYIVGSAQQVEVTGLPVQEVYQFISRMRI